MLDVVIAGGGPSGNYTAFELARAGLKVLVLEEHPEIGAPVHCTGIVGDGFLREFKIPGELVRKKLAPFRLFYSNYGHIECPPNVAANLIHRKRFDEYLAGMADREGAEYQLSSKVTEATQNGKCVELAVRGGASTGRIQAKLLIIATGALSELPFSSGIGRPHEFMSSIQVDAEVSDLQGAELYLGSGFAPGSFAYAVALDGSASKIGVISRGDARRNLENLIKGPFFRERLLSVPDNFSVRRIPQGFPGSSVSGRIVAVGDAAGQLKTTTGGGIFYGLLCSRILAEIIIRAQIRGDFSLPIVASYDRAWKKKIANELRMGLLYRRFIERISDEELQGILDILGSKKMLDIVRKTADFDFHQKLILSLLKVPEFRSCVYRLIRGSFRFFG